MCIISEELERFIINTEAYLEDMLEQMLQKPLPELTEEKFALFEQTGNRLIYEREYFAKRKFLTIYGVAALWVKRKKRAALGNCTTAEIYCKLEEILFSVCEEVCWALPAHVDRAGNMDWRNTIDLFAAETAQTLMDIVDAVGDNLNTSCVAAVRNQVQGRVLQPFFKSSPGSYGWESCDNNWNAVCNGALGSAYLHSLADGEVPNSQYLQRIYRNLNHYIEGFAEDGTCTEGLGYYFYGMVYFVNFAQELFEVSKGQKNLLCGDKPALIAKWWSKCYFKDGLTVSFSDGNCKEKYRMGLGCILAEQFHDIEIPSAQFASTLEEDACYRYLPFKQDVFLSFTSRNELHSYNMKQARGKVHILPVAQWCIGQAGKEKSIGFACKGGHNGESHNHNDVGSFIYLAGGEMLLTDLGAGEYTGEYFGPGRYTILCNRSLGHNVPLIAGKEQSPGDKFGCEKFYAEEDDTCAKVIMWLEKAYDQADMKTFQRRIVFEKISGACTITDDFESEKELIVTENLVTQILPKIKENEVWLEGRDINCRIQIKPAQTPKIIPMEHRNHQGIIEQVYLIQWDVLVANKSQVEIYITV